MCGVVGGGMADGAVGRAPTRRVHDSPDEWPIDSSAKNTGMRLTAGVFFCFVPQATAGGRAGLFVDIDPIPPNTNLGEGPRSGDPGPAGSSVLELWSFGPNQKPPGIDHRAVIVDLQ
jgi:hypothetical protein